MRYFIREITCIYLVLWFLTGDLLFSSECAFRYRRIPGDTCVDGLEKDFMPASTPCPVKGKNVTFLKKVINGCFSYVVNIEDRAAISSWQSLFGT